MNANGSTGSTTFISKRRESRRQTFDKSVISGFSGNLGTREVCALYNDGEHLHARIYTWGIPSENFRWLKYQEVQPLSQTYVGGYESIVNLHPTLGEGVQLYHYGHRSPDGEVLVRFRFMKGVICVERKLWIPRSSIVSVALQSSQLVEQIVFSMSVVL